MKPCLNWRGFLFVTGFQFLVTSYLKTAKEYFGYKLENKKEAIEATLRSSFGSLRNHILHLYQATGNRYQATGIWQPDTKYLFNL